MRVRRRVGCMPLRAFQRGQAVLFVVLLLAVGIGLFAYGAVSSVSLSQQQDVKTRLALTMARDALIGRAASDANRPGSLPCPDFDNDGSADLYAGSDCPGYLPGSNVYVGRLPWRTLGLPDLRDESGERLWYAVLREFARNPSCAPTCPINSDTKGNITVYADSTATTLTSEAVAIIFAPGAPLGTQNRSTSATALCPTTGTIIAQNLCAANYLDSTGSINNATPTANPPLAPAPSFIAAQNSAGFNDRLLVLTTSDLMPLVEQRVARELRTILQNYKANTACACTTPLGLTGCYPWADLSNGYSDADPYDIGSGRNRGRVPAIGAAPYNWGATPCGTGPLAVPTLPAWFVDNDWRLVVYYSAGQNYLGPGACTTCAASTLTVDAASKEVVILMPGPLLGVAPRAQNPPGVPVPLDDPTYWQYYFDDPDWENRDFANDVYVTPSSTAYTRDRIFTIP